jgi:hypothetical protein
LLQREFAEFKDDLILEPSVIAFKLLDDLTLASCKWHDNENLRRDEIASVIGNTANVSLLPTFISGSSRSTDGNTHPATVIPALIECKNNEGCALFEAIAYYSNFLRCHLNLSDGQTELFTRFPSILMADVGKLGNLLISPAAKRLARDANRILLLCLDGAEYFGRAADTNL